MNDEWFYDAYRFKLDPHRREAQYLNNNIYIK